MVIVGTLEADRIELVAPEREVINRIVAREGESVNAGQLLLQMDSTSATAELEALQAVRNQAAARVAELERGPRRELIAEARARVEGSRSQVAEAEKNLNRQQSLIQKKLASEAMLERAQTGFDSALAKLKVDSEALNALESGTTDEELQQAHQALLQARARIIPAQVRVQKLSVASPVAGVIDDIVFDVGEQPNQQAVVAVILASDRRYARVYIPQGYRTAMRVGSELSVRIDGVSKLLTGRVTQISSDPAFTPYYALTERDRSRLAYLAEIDLSSEDVSTLPVGLPLEVIMPILGD